jgi:hypothetical protein
VSEINWDDAPEEATHWDSDAEYFCHNKGWWLDCGQYVKDEYQSAWGTSRYHARPAKSPSERERLQNKPSWEGAPEWAEWLAQDSDGEWFWFIDRPVIYKFTFQPVKSPQGIQLASKGEVLGDWRDTLERRIESIIPPTHENMRCIVNPIERKEWNGPEDGLPPVGGECEMKLADNLNYHKGHVSYYGDEILVWVCNGMEWSYSKSSCNFRPITTEEDRAVDEMLLLDPYDMNSGVGMMSRQDFCRTLYRAGYRKQEESK